MPSPSPESKLVKGALVAYASSSSGSKQKPRLVEFQYNPSELSRSLQHRGQGQQGGGEQQQGTAQEDVRRTKGPPTESIDLSIEIDAADQTLLPGESASEVGSSGLHPVIAALELLLYPKASQDLRSFATEETSGTVDVAYAEEEVPLVLFVWGDSRVLPVKLTSLSITEEAFDSNLNPVRASADLSMDVLNYDQLKEESIGREAYLTTHSKKQRLAQRGYSSSSDRVEGLEQLRS